MGLQNCVSVCSHNLNNFWLEDWILAKFSQSVNNNSHIVGLVTWPQGAHHQVPGGHWLPLIVWRETTKWIIPRQKILLHVIVKSRNTIFNNLQWNSLLQIPLIKLKLESIEFPFKGMVAIKELFLCVILEVAFPLQVYASVNQTINDVFIANCKAVKSFVDFVWK